MTKIQFKQNIASHKLAFLSDNQLIVLLRKLHYIDTVYIESYLNPINAVFETFSTYKYLRNLSFHAAKGAQCQWNALNRYIINHGQNLKSVNIITRGDIRLTNILMYTPNITSINPYGNIRALVFQNLSKLKEIKLCEISAIQNFKIFTDQYNAQIIKITFEIKLTETQLIEIIPQLWRYKKLTTLSYNNSNPKIPLITKLFRINSLKRIYIRINSKYKGIITCKLGFKNLNLFKTFNLRAIQAPIILKPVDYRQYL